MASIDTGFQDMTRRALCKASGAAQVTFSRLDPATGDTLASATVTALVRNYLQDGSAASQAGVSASAPGAVTLGDRFFLVMADELAAKSFPLPLRKGDKLSHADTGEILTIARVDAGKRAIAGAIEGYAVTP